MLRVLGLGLVTAIALVSGPAQREALTHGEYVAAVQAAADRNNARRLFEDVVNTDSYPCRVCHRDPRTAVGSAWVRSERSLRTKLEALAERLDGIRPPADVAQLHAAWRTALRGCAEQLHELEGELRRIPPPDERSQANQTGKLDATDVFQNKVALEVERRCFDHFNEIIPEFNDKGYDFS